ncbi:hypothetical protein FHX82_004543 [Amycolatopsis bartoniae]|uniref:Uncharacterized protein n=1 Tax=Amycolatopsis bartoniae TaxID=941986 RepID=A0A8H9J557_9PSEU|nr:hypothetical protein [Amycolatopsis bartoniae]TVS99771.1 hypothetical protein FNH07_33685 [Amycolatopsis bartoniae]GHF86996.1 hypothetical protein GCM10017566_71100 [Amycolatopsis bartoniae]
MHELIEVKRSEIEALCRALSVRRLDVFGAVERGGNSVKHLRLVVNPRHSREGILVLPGQ